MKTEGPEIFRNAPHLDARGWFPANTHGWYSVMQAFASSPKTLDSGGDLFLYEYGAPLGYQVNVQLRPGEKLVRNWSNQGLYVDKADGRKHSSLSAIDC